MLRHVWNLNLESRARVLLFNSRRFKGHSHWQNIRHIKQENDAKRAMQLSMYTRKLDGIIAKSGGNCNVETNSALASVIEQARKENMSVTTLLNYLKKKGAKDTNYQWTFYRGPDKYVIAVSYDRKRQPFYKQAFNKICFRKNINLQEISNATDVFSTKGIILSKAPSKDITLEKAEEDAIIAGAEDFLEIESDDKEEKVFQFITLFEDLYKVVNTLKEQGWTMYEHKHELVPLYCIELPEDRRSVVIEVVTLIEDIPEVEKVTINIA